MRRTIFCFLMLVSSIGFSQNSNVQLSGNVTVPEGDDPDGITIFNEATSKGTISNEQGEFKLTASLNDRIVFSSLQFEQFSIRITEDILESRMLNVSINIALNELPEVRVSAGTLSGSIAVDVNRIEVTPAQIPNMNVSMMGTPKIDTPETHPVRNEAQLSGQTYMVNGLNLINVFKLVTGKYGKEKNDYRAIPYAQLDDEIKEMYSNDFFKETLDLEANQVNDFIFFAADNGLDGRMLTEENELDIIQFLVEQRTAYQGYLNAEVETLD
ncbi:hypothetical protein INR75_00500 [Zunongwangia sp. SCSIO 43204]|uniref:carboxypeptidase-like regulatory domain-containing protein n=1 Tax=Zunongwangia sp. SCSIO 43204 TaxID=2779359 RepID=UPI001CA99004|nr:carboxypeptidase-like regulatory domain-containing protein [Zunongwangia sp. SCSIO 43204]UAB84557.1 hypothetical protein INR75_00500 [Zunongwangia sp. SCSIO 43204]